LVRASIRSSSHEWHDESQEWLLHPQDDEELDESLLHPQDDDEDELQDEDELLHPQDDEEDEQDDEDEQELEQLEEWRQSHLQFRLQYPSGAGSDHLQRFQMAPSIITFPTRWVVPSTTSLSRQASPPLNFSALT
jgi:hypothetical protein